MPHPSDRIAALIGSRICHDLISPVGAIGNGLELLELSGQPPTPEMSLLAQSAADASARIRLFRLAFGDAGAGQRVAAQDVAQILAAVYGAGRVSVAWQAAGDHPRGEVKAALLALFCAKTALAGSGRIAVTRAGGQWRIHATADRLSLDPALWSMLEGAAAPEHIAPAAVQFLLLPGACAAENMSLVVHLSENELEILI